tara:strand:- start:71 stop:430 length:360 start_codon:yes stop_codon:yes gene_type:complete
MSKIKKVEEKISYNVYTTFSKDEGMYQVIGNVYATVWKATGCGKFYEHQVDEVEIRYCINNKKVKYDGFKALYEQLYGVGSFKIAWDAWEEEFIIEYHNTTPYADAQSNLKEYEDALQK